MPNYLKILLIYLLILQKKTMSIFDLFNLNGSQLFGGIITDTVTYKNVKRKNVKNLCSYMCNVRGVNNVFIYNSTTNDYIAAYSKKYNNFRYKNGKTYDDLQ